MGGRMILLIAAALTSQSVFAICVQPDAQTASSLGRKCVDGSRTVQDARICGDYYLDYAKTFDEWRVCRIVEMQAENAERISKFVSETNIHSNRFRKHGICLSLGKLGDPGSVCDVGNWD